MKYRIERDSMGEIKVPAQHYWAAQTQRSLNYFQIGWEKMPLELIKSLAMIKAAAASANHKLGKLSDIKKQIITQVCEEIINGQWQEEFPLSVWQTGSGTQTNMNVNEVISRRGNEIIGHKLLHANDDVNMSQSSNDVFPTAMNITAAMAIKNHLQKAMLELIKTLNKLEKENDGIVKIGRTHLQDAVPIQFSKEISAWRTMIEKNLSMIEASLPGLMELALGGTAVGSGLNAPEGFACEVVEEINQMTGLTFVSAENKYHALSSKDAFVFSHGALKALAANLMKIANDIRWLASGPRCGLGEISIPENEPGSSIMPGKVNPTQAEAITMIAVQVMANDVAIGLAASQGNFQLNVFMPVCIYNYLQSVQLLGDGINSFCSHCLSGLKARTEKMKQNLHSSLMTATALNPVLGYDRVAQMVKKAYQEEITLKEACLLLGFLEEAEFDLMFKPEEQA